MEILLLCVSFSLWGIEIILYLEKRYLKCIIIVHIMMMMMTVMYKTSG